jgi:hypothetical protein
MSRMLVAGVGNIFRSDDGFGVEVVRQLAGRPHPDGVGTTFSSSSTRPPAGTRRELSPSSKSIKASWRAPDRPLRVAQARSSTPTGWIRPP